MIEFITKYQIPLIIFGILIIMALIGYEAEQREAIKRGDKKQKEKKKKNKKERLAEVSEAIVDEKENESIVDVNTEINEEVFAIDDNIQEQSADINEEYAQTEEPVEESFNGTEENYAETYGTTEENYAETYGTTEENYGQDVVDNTYSVEPMEVSNEESNDFVNNMNQFANDMGMPEMESYATDNTEGYEKQETNIFEQEYPEVSNYEQINTPTYEEQTYQSENVNVQPTNVDDSLQAFMEPSTPTDDNDSFGVNDMSIFESPQAPSSEEQSNNMQEWKL